MSRFQRRRAIYRRYALWLKLAAFWIRPPLYGAFLIPSDEPDSLSEPSSLTFGNECRELLSSGSYSRSFSADESEATDDMPDMLDFPIASVDKIDNSLLLDPYLKPQNK